MTTVKAATSGDRRRRAARAALSLSAICASLALAGCGTSGPPPVGANELAEAQTFPYFRVYWAGPSFDGQRLSAATGLKGYVSNVGASVYYGDCVQSGGIFGGGSCVLPLQVTTVIYTLHANAALGPQHNMLLRGVPAVVYDEGRSIEIYTGRLAIDIFSDTYAHAVQAAEELRPVNAPGSASAALPAPVYCPGLSGAVDATLERVLEDLPRRACQQTAAEQAYIRKVGSR
jgi:hypothetical protein